MNDWNNIRYFIQGEFDSPDKPGSGELMQEKFVQNLDELRSQCGFPFYITSGYRTLEHNQEVGGTTNSAHQRGWAADISVSSNRQRFTLVNLALAMGITRIGIGNTFIHLDLDPASPPNVIWTY